MISPSPKSDLRSLFEQALELMPIERAHFLREVQFRSPILYQQLRSLLIAHQGPSAFFEQDGGLWAQLAPTVLTGRRFGAYVIEEEIGRGGMGAVYRATRADEAFHKTVAIKIVSGGVMLSESALDSFRRERQILAQLEHPHIARLLDGGSTDDGLLYLIMEFVDGQSLDRYVENKQPGIPEILKLFLDVASAVSFAHRNLVVHRDLKPSNIMVTEAGEVKLLDFGIAKVLSADRAATATVAMRLTPEFASPEQIRGESISTASDVYSFGVILFHILTGGVKPYRTTSQSMPEIMQAVLDNEVPPPSTVAPARFRRGLKGDLDTIIRKAMAKEIERRYASVDQLSEDIRRHLTGRPILAEADNWAYRSGKFLRRHRAAAAGVAVLALTIAGGILATLQQATIAQQERAAAVDARLVAESQRKLALESQEQAQRQRMLAEDRSREALQERARADVQRSTAESRYQSVRSLATAIVFDVNESLRDLPGSGPARRKALLAALKHLEDLSRKSGADLALTEDLAAAYEQVGEIMESLYDQSKEGGSLAVPAYIKAAQLRMKLVEASKFAAPESLRLSEAQRQLGNSHLNAGQSDMAIASYQDSLRTIERLPASRAALRLSALARSNLCTAHTIRSEIKQALPHCANAVETLQKIAGDEDADINQLKVLTAVRYGNVLHRAGNDPEANEQYRFALAGINPLDGKAARTLDELVGLLKPNAAFHDIQSVAMRKYAVALERDGKKDSALEQFEEALKRDGVEKPSMQDVLAYAEAASEQGVARAMFKNGQARQAIEASKRAISRLAQCCLGSAKLLRDELDADIRNFETSFAQPLR